jgi:hypothetical protein
VSVLGLEAGMTTIQYVAAIALSLLAFVTLANFVVDVYARGVVRSAIDEGARAGAAIDSSPADCERRVRDVLATLLSGAAGRAVEVSCRESDRSMHARARVVLPGWIPGVPAWTFTVDGSVVKEQVP